MSIGPDAAELLGKPQPPAGATPTETLQPGGATPAAPAAPGQEDSTKTVPLAALMGEQENTKKAREALGLVRSQLEPLGFQVGDDGTVYRVADAVTAEPQPKPPSRVQRLAEQLGIDPAEFQAAFAEMAGPFATPLASGATELSKQFLAEKDPDYALYAKSIDNHLGKFDAAIRGHPETFRFAVKLAKLDHEAEIDEAKWERRQKGQGKVVGRFVEGASPGVEAGATPVLDPTTAAWAQSQGFTPEEMAKAAEIRAQREGRK